MKQIQIKQLLLATFLTIGLYSCKKDAAEQAPEITPGKYEKGFFIITEGAYGQTSGNINFYRYGEDTLTVKVYEKENPGSILANAAKLSTLQFASVIDGHIYLLCKMNGPIIKVNAQTLKEEARLSQEPSNWRSLIQIEGNRGLVSANDGIYQIDLATLTIGNKLTSVAAINTGDMWKKGNYAYLLQNDGAKIISTNNHTLVKSFSNIKRGFAETPNGKIWASTGTRLIAIDSNLDTTGTALPVSIGSFGLDAPTRITASTKENAIFYHSGKAIYKYMDGNSSTLAKPFINISENPFMVYGAIRYDQKMDYLIVNGIGGYGAASSLNYLLIYNATDGTLVKSIKYGGDGLTANFNNIYFPTLAVFN